MSAYNSLLREFFEHITYINYNIIDNLCSFTLISHTFFPSSSTGVPFLSHHLSFSSPVLFPFPSLFLPTSVQVPSPHYSIPLLPVYFQSLVSSFLM